MRYLLDTHIFLWWLNDDKRLSSRVKDIIKDNGNVVCVSVASAWEISIKLKTNSSFKLKTTIAKTFKIAEFTVLDISLRHALRLHTLPLHHKDPFDRMLVAQAQEDEMVLITNDPKIKKYDISILPS